MKRIVLLIILHSSLFTLRQPRSNTIARLKDFAAHNSRLPCTISSSPNGFWIMAEAWARPGADSG